MKNLLTTNQLREKYDPESILKDIEKTFEANFEKLISSLTHKDCPLNKYDQDIQISFLDSEPNDSDDLVKKVASLLKDTIYFMTLSKKDRTKVTQKMRAYYSDMVKNQLYRIEQLLDDPEIGSPKHINDPSPKHKGMAQVFQILTLVQSTLQLENDYRRDLARSGYLTGLQISMGNFFVFLNKLGMNQKDQITLVQHLFDDFKVDWEEGDRENIRLSLQNPALEYHKMTHDDLQKTSGTLFSNKVNDSILSNLTEQAIILKKRIRRF